MKLSLKKYSDLASTDQASTICHQLAPGIWTIEAGYCPVPAHDPDCMPVWRALTAGTAVSLSTATALQFDLGLMLVAWLQQNGYSIDQYGSLALHELITNAVVHGNLGIASKNLNNWQDLIRHEADIAAACQDSRLSGRLVTVALGWSDDYVVAIVSDEGGGYEIETPCEPTRGSGRGLGIARAAGTVDVLNGGRQTVLTLDRGRPEPGC